MIRPPLSALCLAFAGMAASSPVPAQIVTESGQTLPPYAAVASRVIAAPAIADVTVRQASRLRPEESAGLAPGHARFYVVADVTALIRGPSGFPAQVSYLADVPLDPRGRPPRLRRQRAIIFARPVPGRVGEVQLVAPDAQQAWTAALDARVRGIARELVAADAPPAITGIGNAFHVAGTLPGEGETQIFLNTADRRPVSLTVLRRPGEERRWAVALAEVVDERAGAPARDTLLWYRLACGLPRSLPAAAIATLAADDAANAREDYAFVLDQLGPCET